MSNMRDDFLECGNRDCPSHSGADSPCFNVNVSVYANGDMAERITKVPPKHFTCVYCSAEAAAKEGA